MNLILYPATSVSDGIPPKANVANVKGYTLPFDVKENLAMAVPAQTQIAFAGQRESDKTLSRQIVTVSDLNVWEIQFLKLTSELFVTGSFVQLKEMSEIIINAGKNKDLIQCIFYHDNQSYYFVALNF